jgi:AhpD family alkylhydroperoxidase
MGTIENPKEAIFAQVREKFGIVPSWLFSVPEAALPGLWKLQSDFYLAETAIPNKYKELIGLAVSGATRCRYCALFHTEGARLAGATEAEIAEASMMAGATMMVSTYLNALQVDYDRFVEETRQIVDFARKNAGLRPDATAAVEQHAK